MTDRINKTMYGSNRLNRSTLYFKKFKKIRIDQNGKKNQHHLIYFLWASGARMN